MSMMKTIYRGAAFSAAIAVANTANANPDTFYHDGANNLVAATGEHCVARRADDGTSWVIGERLPQTERFDQFARRVVEPVNANRLGYLNGQHLNDDGNTTLGPSACCGDAIRADAVRIMQNFSQMGWNETVGYVEQSCPVERRDNDGNRPTTTGGFEGGCDGGGCGDTGTQGDVEGPSDFGGPNDLGFNTVVPFDIGPYDIKPPTATFG